MAKADCKAIPNFEEQRTGILPCSQKVICEYLVNSTIDGQISDSQISDLDNVVVSLTEIGNTGQRAGLVKKEDDEFKKKFRIGPCDHQGEQNSRTHLVLGI